MAHSIFFSLSLSPRTFIVYQQWSYRDATKILNVRLNLCLSALFFFSMALDLRRFVCTLKTSASFHYLHYIFCVVKCPIQWDDIFISSESLALAGRVAFFLFLLFFRNSEKNSIRHYPIWSVKQCWFGLKWSELFLLNAVIHYSGR